MNEARTTDQLKARPRERFTDLALDCLFLLLNAPFAAGRWISQRISTYLNHPAP